MESNRKEKGQQTCPYCKKEFKQLSRHKCKNIPENEAGLDERQDSGGAIAKETKPKLSKGKSYVPLSETKDSHSSPFPRCSFEESSGSIPKHAAEQSKGGKTETCKDCGKSFKCLANHKKCKMRKENMGADNMRKGQMAPSGAQATGIQDYEKKKLPSVGTMTKHSETEERRENQVGSRRLDQQDSQLTPQRKHMECAPSIDQGRGFTSCQYCGKEFKQVQKHVRFCKENPLSQSGANSIDVNDKQSKSIDQSQLKKSQSKWPEPDKYFPEVGLHDSVELSSSTAEEEYAKEPKRHLNKFIINGCLISRNTLSATLSINDASLADVTFSADPTAELAKLQAGSIIDIEEKSRAEQVVKEMEENFLRKLNEKSNFKWSIFRTGSFSDETRIKTADEFDFIVSLGIQCNEKYLEDPGTLGYCLVVPIIERNVHQEISGLMKDMYLDPNLVKDMAFKLFDAVIQDPDFRKGRRMKRLQRDNGSPAFTFSYSAGGGHEYDIDLVSAIHFDGWPHIPAITDWKPKWRQRHSLQELRKDHFAVARENPNAKTLSQGELLWRLSFSRTDKMLWLNADNNGQMPTCRKKILMILKRVLEECKNKNAAVMPHLSSFHLRTFMLHQYDKRPEDNEWLETKLRQCLYLCIQDLTEILSIRNMSNYYIRGHNVLQTMEDEEIEIFKIALAHASVTY
ncbi:hypothetical protein ACJMK2_029781 [Sinanodonta woodiana]|uniref:Uncharacterized protein n=1 Tax=Sinanodonta woodiana TaxID=1069815 RepID=A0ABD3XF42_SINWO